MVPPVSILLDEDPERTWTSARKFDSGSLVTCLGMKELFVVYIAAIGHDVAHPGFTNLFMRNAETPLSMVYDGKSALEQMHCSLLLRVMRHYGLGPLLDDNCGSGGNGSTQSVRKLLSETVLATDMSVHSNFMENFKALVDDGITQSESEAEEGESQLWRRQVLLCQGIMKCADISNPVSKTVETISYIMNELITCSVPTLSCFATLGSGIDGRMDIAGDAREIHGLALH